MSLFAVVMPVVVEVEVVFLVNLDTSSESLTGYYHQDNNLFFLSCFGQLSLTLSQKSLQYALSD